MAVRKAHLDVLEDYLEPSGPNDQDEWYLKCPLHDDHTRSASLNVRKSMFYCFRCGGMPVGDLVELIRSGAATNTNRSNGNGHRPKGRKAKTPAPTVGTVKGWHAALMQDESKVRELRRRRGLSKATLREYVIGWSTDDRAYTIPVFDSSGHNVKNVRFYRFDVPEDRRKIWSVEGCGSPQLYPLPATQEWSDLVVICEGEWDCLLTRQHGIECITRTASADTWRSQWNTFFENKVVFLCHDMDKAGQRANKKVELQLEGVAKEIHTLLLPYETTEKHGRDLTDYWLEGNTRDDFLMLMANAMADGDLNPVSESELEESEPVDVTVLDTFSSEYVGQSVGMKVTITGKKFPTWTIPAKCELTCTIDAGAKCTACPMNDDTGGWAGKTELSFPGSDPLVMEMLDQSQDKIVNMIRNHLGIVRCNRLSVDVVRHMSVEELYVRPSVESVEARFSTEPGDYTNRKVLSVGRHDTMPNNTVQMTGTVRPNPSSQRNELQAWAVEKTETSIDRFEMTDAIARRLAKFKPRKGQRPLAKCFAIADDLESHVTHIYGQPQMHVVMDLVFHSVLALPYNGALLERGWLDVLIIGDTRTGKSETASRLIRHYRAGEFVSCEAATFAGIVGGLQQYGGREWSVTWGVVPLNDRRLVALDEVSGLTTDQIAQMSSIRSSGLAQLTKIQSERTFARTRLMWLGNPRDGGKLADRTFGVRSILPLIGNNEDVARFDLAMAIPELRDPKIIERDFEEKADPVYSSAACSELVLWAWSRQPEHITWEAGAERLCHTLGMELGRYYASDPPLIQSANVRVKLARLAAALAARTFSSPDGEKLLITKQHVRDVVDLIHQVYDAPEFGYGEQSQAISDDIEIARESRGSIYNLIIGTAGLYEFFRDVQTFTVEDVALVCQFTHDQAAAVINDLWKARAIEKGKGRSEFKQASVLLEIVRKIGAESR